MNSKHTTIDNLETLILMALESDKQFSDNNYEHGQKTPTGHRTQVISEGSITGLPDKQPLHSYTFDASGDRLYSDDKRFLLKGVFETVGSGFETIVLHEGFMKWILIEPCKRPKKFCPIGKVEKWFAIHYRTYFPDGTSDYTKAVCPFNKYERAVPYRIEGWNLNGFVASDVESQIVLCCSMMEDVKRSGALVATVTGDASISFSIDLGFHKDFLALRDGPNKTPTGRKNPIISLVKKHIRSKPKKAEVKSHWRGTDSVSINGLTLAISTENFKEESA